MASKICPGQNTLFWRPDDIYDILCPYCHEPVEFFKTDVKRTCPNCGQKILNPKVDFSCAEWCSKAEECLGPVVYDEFMEKKELDRRRKEHFERLLATVDPADVEVRKLFERLFRENTNPGQLLDFDQLRALKDEVGELVGRATQYYSQFTKRKQMS